jgi:hypothetical protein
VFDPRPRSVKEEAVMRTDLSHPEADIEVLASIKKGGSMSGAMRSRVTQTSLEVLRDLGMSDHEIDRYLRRFGIGALDLRKAATWRRNRSSNC